MRSPVLMFDFGNVLAFFDYTIIYGKLGARLGLSAEAFHELAKSKGLKGRLSEFESGRLSPEEFSAIVQREVGLDITFEEFAEAWQDIFELNAPVAALAAELKAGGYTLLLGSNTNALHATFYRRQFRETLDQFDHFVLSHEILAMKPSRAFFEACTRAVGAPADSCIFIDDVEENVQGAREAGLVGLVYTDAATLRDDLRALGVDPTGPSFESPRT
ncbi:HAD family hydrolase [Planctomyces sp. SH-PL62]|uniref:HAD family hydrolase n=1 Tax=Planctomyces sp. SH-PL62 TaxID=1636152 RepID=UPI00078B3623|nr:HAD family phosphatase [Planctomyces sp. SH-PL62]AMV39419.1 Alpha-D-glucose-1-phosphate phosphatase YihX [Planctomyces sp. SH-PL62]